MKKQLWVLYMQGSEGERVDYWIADIKDDQVYIKYANRPDGTWYRFDARTTPWTEYQEKEWSKEPISEEDLFILNL